MSRQNRRSKGPKPEPLSLFKNHQELKGVEAAKESDARWHGLTRGEWTLAVIAVVFGLGAFFVPEVRQVLGRPPENPATEYRPTPPKDAFKKTEPEPPKADDSKPSGDSAKFRLIPENPKTVVKRTPVRQAQNSFDYRVVAPHKKVKMNGECSTCQIVNLPNDGMPNIDYDEVTEHLIGTPPFSDKRIRPRLINPAGDSSIVTLIVSIEKDGSVKVGTVLAEDKELAKTISGAVENWRFIPFQNSKGESTAVGTSIYFAK